MPQVPFAFELESEPPNDNSVKKTVTKLLFGCSAKVGPMGFLRIVIWPFDQLYPNLMNGNSVTVLSPNCHSAVQISTQT